MNENETTSTVTTTDDWAEIDLSDLTDSAAEETTEAADAGAEDTQTSDQPEGSGATGESQPADQQAEGTPAEPEGGAAEQKPSAVADQYELKHLDETRIVNRDEVISLAQKGMDYDRIRGAYDFVSELAAAQNVTVENFIDNARASVLAKKDGIEFNTALGRIKLEREKSEFEAKKAQSAAAGAQAAQKAEAERRMNEDIAAFRRTFPNVDGKTIPQSVWEDVGRGMTLVNAYAKFDNAQKLAEIQSAKKETENKRKSAGSVQSSGKSLDDEAFDSLWNDGT